MPGGRWRQMPSLDIGSDAGRFRCCREVRQATSSHAMANDIVILTDILFSSKIVSVFFDERAGVVQW